MVSILRADTYRPGRDWPVPYALPSRSNLTHPPGLYVAQVMGDDGRTRRALLRVVWSELAGECAFDEAHGIGAQAIEPGSYALLCPFLQPEA